MCVSMTGSTAKGSAASPTCIYTSYCCSEALNLVVALKCTAVVHIYTPCVCVWLLLDMCAYPHTAVCSHMYALCVALRQACMYLQQTHTFAPPISVCTGTGPT